MIDQSRLSREIRLNNYLLPLVVIGLAIQNYFSPHRAWEALLFAFGGTLLLSTIWAISLWKGLSFQREMRQGWAQVGDRFSEQFTISNTSRFSALSVALIDHSNFPGYRSNVVWPVKKNFDKLWYMDSVCYVRGLYNVGPTEIHSSDPFGIFKIKISSSNRIEFLVTPPIIPLSQIGISTGEWHGSGGTQTKMFERTVTSTGVREYTSTDSLFSVHWLSSARHDDLYVRTFDQQPSSDWWIFLDMDRYVQVGEGLDTTDEYATVLAASIADRALSDNRAVGLVSEGIKPLWLPPKTGAGQRAEIMVALATINRGDMPLKTLIAKSQRSMGRKSSAIIITPSVGTEWLNAVTNLKQKGVATTVLLFDTKDFGGIAPSTPNQHALNSWGINNYLIKKSIYQRPEIQEFYPNQWNAFTSTSILSPGDIR
jgi:uncharacterized protein (DUF58 family)